MFTCLVCNEDHIWNIVEHMELYHPIHVIAVRLAIQDGEIY